MSTSPSPSTITTVGVVGSGIMGSGLAEVIARAGMTVIVRSRQQSTADAMVASVAKGLAKQVEKGRLAEDESTAILGRITAVADLKALADCDLIIESVVEDLATKKSLIAELDAIAKPSAIIGTNTSTLPVIELAMSTNRPDKVCGIHFFNPATAMPLVEIIRPLSASDETISTATAFAEACGKQPVQVQDRAGFIVNALLFPYLNNAARMLELGTASKEDIDAAMKGGCNFPMGPFALLDLVGLDTSLAILDALYDEFRDPNYAAVPILRRMVAAGQLGRKSKVGFYSY
jgi:3-hydroxybutyryl-CoA dehydrogenase